MEWFRILRLENRLSLLLAVLCLLCLVAGCESQVEPTAEERFVVTSILGSEAQEGFARVSEPRPFDFPTDHGPHCDYQIEWWYTTGNLEGRDGAGKAQPFGFELTFFRVSLTAEPDVPAAKNWPADQLHMTHFAVTDVAGERFVAFDRWDRGALGLAGAEANPRLRVWNGDWELRHVGESPDRFELVAGEEDLEVGAFELQLTLESRKPMVLQGERGYSRKGPQPGNASFYTSHTRLQADGTLKWGARTFEINGQAWLDHEWSTSALGGELVGWDWFALQFADGSELMVYQLRRQDGSADPYSAGTWVATDGTTTPLARSEFELEVLGEWVSPKTGFTYPNGWRVRVPTLQLDVTVTPRMADQELDLFTVYWEGAVAVSGRRAGQPVGGYGYVELVGYE